MKALVYTGVQTLEYKTVPDPIPAEGDSLIKVESVGICGSDMHAYLGHDERRPAPLILGHESAGLVLEGGLKGKRVTVNPLVTCGSCEDCIEGRDNICYDRQIISMPPREGAFAEYLTIPTRNLTEIPESLSYDKASLCEPLACGWHAVRLGLEMLSREPEKIRALVIGGGAIGFGSALNLNIAGVKDITVLETNTARTELLKKHTGDSGMKLLTAPEREDYHLVMDCVGFGKTREIASKHVRRGGLIVHIGLGDNREGLDTRRLTLQEIAFLGTYTYTAADFRDTAAAIISGKFGALEWPEILPLQEGWQAFKDLSGGITANPKVILKPF